MVNPWAVTSVTFIDLNAAVGCLMFRFEHPTPARNRTRNSGQTLRGWEGFIRSHLQPDDAGFEGELAIHDAVNGAADAMVAFPLLLPDKVKANAGRDLHAELGFLDPAEADETFPADEGAGVKTCELGGGFDHQHAGKKRPARDVARDPELVRPHVFVADDASQRRFRVDDGVEHLHLAALRVGGPDRLLIVNHAVEVDAGDVKDELGRHGYEG